MNKLIKKISEWSPKENLFKNRVILITGSTRGIGRSLTLRLASLGTTCLILGRDELSLNSLYDNIIENGGPEPVIIPIDLSTLNERKVKDLNFEIEDNFGRLDGLANIAGILGAREPILTHRINLWNEVIQVNLTSVFLLTKGLLPLLDKSQSGRIIMTTATVGRKGKAFWGAYGVSKAGIEILSNTLAEELEKTSKTRLITINPGRVATSMRSVTFPAEDSEVLPKPQDILDIFLWGLSSESEAGHGKSLNCLDILKFRKKTKSSFR